MYVIQRENHVYVFVLYIMTAIILIDLFTKENIFLH